MRDNAGVQILGFLTLLFFALFLYKYFSTPTSFNQVPLTQTQLRQHPQHPQQGQQGQPRQQVQQRQEETVRSDDTINMNKNDLHIVNNKFNIYTEGEHIDTTGFENELANNHLIDRTFASELDDLYNEMDEESRNMILSMQQQPLQADSCNISKPQKTDLPIANVPAYLLTKNEPLRLSEKPRS